MLQFCLLGSEVAQYAATHFPEFLKSVAAYNEGSLATALENAFLGFDATLVTDDVKKQLKVLAASAEKTDEEDATDEESMLRVYFMQYAYLLVLSCLMRCFQVLKPGWAGYEWRDESGTWTHFNWPITSY